jgi:peptide/nickel transport system substrate-binding protein
MVGANASEDTRIAEIARASLERLGFEVQLRLVSYDTLLSRYCGVSTADVAICPTLGWVADFADGQAMLAPTFGGDAIQEISNPNVSELNDDTVDEAMRQAELLTDPSERAEAWGEIDRQITELAPAVPWLWDNGIVLASDDVRMAINPANGGLPDLAHVALR